MAQEVIRIILYGILMWGVFFYALFRGSWPERLAAGGIVVGSYMTTFAVLFLTSFATRYRQTEIPILSIDVGVVLLLLFIAIRSEKFWPLWLTAMQSLTIMGHLAPYVPHMLPWSYWRVTAVWSWPMLIVLAFAIHRHHREQSAGTRYRV